MNYFDSFQIKANKILLQILHFSIVNRENISPPIIGTIVDQSISIGSSPLITVIVVDVDAHYYGKSFAFVLPETAQKLRLKENDVVKIESEKTTYAVVQIIPESEAYLDAGTSLPPLQIDSNVRKNIGIVLGDKVQISKWDALNADRIYLAESEAAEGEKAQPQIDKLVRFLQNRVVQKGEEVWIPSRDVPMVLSSGDGTVPNEATRYYPDIYYLVFHTAPVGRAFQCVRITPKTEIIFRKKPLLDNSHLFSEKIYLSDIGGLKDQKRQLKELVGFKIYQSDLLEQSKLNFANAVLLAGPSGTGKTMLMKAILNEFPVCAFYLNGPEIIGDKPQSTPAELAKIFDEAIKSAPSIIAIDEVEALAFNREDLRFDAIMRNIITQFMQLMDKIAATNDVILLGTTNKPNSIDHAFRTTNRFSKEIQIPTPQESDRKDILDNMINRSPLLNSKIIDTQKIAEEANGFSGADLNLLMQEAFVEHLKEIGIYDQFISRPIETAEIRSKLHINTGNFVTVLKAKRVKPSLLRSYFVETPKIRFSDVGGLKEAKQMLEENIKFPQLYPELYKKFGGKATKGIMLFGPPGCGKTLLAKALAAETNMNFIYIKAAEVLNRWLGESEAAIREIFVRARASSPCIVFFDELDAISTVRGIEGNVHSDRVTAQILTELDGLEELKDVICIGATNRLDIIDPAIMRPGRLYPIVQIGIPTEKERFEILKIHTRNIPLGSDVNLNEIAQTTRDMSGANLEEICHQAALLAIRENVSALYNTTGNSGKTPPSTVGKIHFQNAIKDLIDKIQRAKTEPQRSNIYA